MAGPILQVLAAWDVVRAIMSNYKADTSRSAAIIEGCRAAAMVPLTFAWSDCLGLQGMALAQASLVGLRFAASSVVLSRALRLPLLH